MDMKRWLLMKQLGHSESGYPLDPTDSTASDRDLATKVTHSVNIV